MLDPPRPKAGRALTEVKPPSDVLCRFPGTTASAPTARQLTPPALPCGTRSLSAPTALARHAGFASPVQPGPPSDGPVRVRHSMTQDAFSRVATPWCHVVPFVTSCPRIGLALHLNDFARDLRTSSPSPRHRTRQRCDDILPASAARPARLAAPRCGRRAMRPTDFCFSSLVLRAPSPRGLPTRHGAFAPSSYGEHGVSRHRDSLRRVRRLFLRRGRSLPHGESTRPSL
jgi:hypothetical protein